MNQMISNNEYKTPNNVVRDAEARRAEREKINNKWTSFTKWADPKVKRVVEVATPIIAGSPTGRILDPRDGLVKRGLDVIDQALESKDPEYKAKVIQSIKQAGSKANELFLPSTEDLIRGAGGGPAVGIAGAKLGTAVASRGASSKTTDALVKQAQNVAVEEQAETTTSTWLSENVYDPTNQTVGAAALALNPDTREEAAKRGIDPLSLAWQERKNISTGQAIFDNIASETSFSTGNIYDDAARQELFYGEGFVSSVARGGSGTIDLGAQLVFDPLAIAGTAGKLGRLATLDVKTVAQSTKKLNSVEKAMVASGLADDIVAKPSFFEESFFKEGKAGLDEYRSQRAAQDAGLNEIKILEDDELLLGYQLGNAQDEITLLAPGDPEVARLKEVVATNKQKLIEIKTRKDEINNQPAPTISVGWDEFFDQVATMKPSEIFRHKRMEIFAGGRDRMSATYALAAKTGDKRDLIDLTLIATGVDPDAAARLLARRESIKPIIEDYNLQIKELKVAISDFGEDSPNTAKALAEIREEQKVLVQALKKEDKFLTAAITTEEEMGRSAVSRMPNAGIARVPSIIPGSEDLTRSLERFRARQAKTRASVSIDRPLQGDDFILQEFQISPLARPVYVAQWVGGKFGRFHPTNTVALEGVGTADGVDELVAWMQGAPIWGKSPALFGKPGELIGLDKRRPEFRGEEITRGSVADNKQKLLDDFIIATDRVEKEAAAKAMEVAYARDVLRSIGYDEDVAGAVIKSFLAEKQKKIALFRQENGFYKDPLSDGLTINPMLAKELEYRYMMFDAQKFYDYVLLEKDAIQPAFRLALDSESTLGKSIDFAERFLGGAESLWKSSVLLRGGYAPRSIATELLKWKLFGGLISGFLFSQLGLETTKNVARNKYNFYKRLGSRLERAKSIGDDTFTDELLDPSIKDLDKMGRISAALVSPQEYFDYVAQNNRLRVAKIKWFEEQIEMLPKKDLLPHEEEVLLNYTEQIKKLQNDVIESEKKLIVLDERAEKQKKIRSGTSLDPSRKLKIGKGLYELPFSGLDGMAFRDAISTASVINLSTSTVDSFAKTTGAKLNDDFLKIYPDEKSYYPNLAELINNRWVDDSMSKVLLSGATAEEIEHLLLKKNKLWKENFVATTNKAKYDEIRKEMLDEIKEKTKDSLLTKEQVDDLLSRVPTSEFMYAESLVRIVDDVFPTQEIRDRILSMKKGERLTINELRNLYDDIGGSVKRPIIAGRMDEKSLKKRAELTTVEMRPKSETDPTLVRVPVEKTGDELKRAEEAQRILTSKDPREKPSSIVGDFGRGLKNFGFKWLSIIPEDKIISATFGKMIYLREMKKSVEAFEAAGKEITGLDERLFRAAAFDKAIEESKLYLYRSTRRMKGVGDVPLMSPFIQASVLGMKNWGRITYQDPKIMARRLWLWNEINESADVEKDNGKRTISYTMPSWFIENIELLPGDQHYLKNVLRAFDTMRFSTQSFNLILTGVRGDTEFEQLISTLGVGPTITVPVSNYLKDHPYIDQEILDLTGQAIPSEKIMDGLGVRKFLESIVPAETLTADPTYYQVLPPWSKRLIAIGKEGESAEFARAQMYLIMWHLHRQHPDVAKEPPLDRNDPEAFNKFIDQTSKEASTFLGLRLLANLTLPAIPAWENSEMKPMLDLWNEYQEKETVNAFPRFIEDHPEWFSVTMSLSEGGTGARATTDAAYMGNKHRDLIASTTSLGGTDASADQFIQMIVNRDDRPNTYDPAARIWQMVNEYSVTGETYRGMKTPAEAYLSLQEKKGWKDYMDYKAVRDYELYQLGIASGLGKAASPNMRISEGITADFNAWIDSQQESNPIWWNSYKAGGSETVYPLAVKFGRDLLNNKKWMADQLEGNWTDQLQEYLDERDATAYLLSNTIDEDTRDFYKLDFQQKVNELKLENTTWAYYYDRFFDGDKLEVIR
jgi:hypothetical protein